MYNTTETLMASVTVLRQTTGITSCQEFSSFLNTNNNLYFPERFYSVAEWERGGGEGGGAGKTKIKPTHPYHPI